MLKARKKEVHMPTRQYNCVFLDDLSDSNDLFELKPTIEKIKNHIEENYIGDENCYSYLNNTLALMGPWGSGKSTVFFNIFKHFHENTGKGFLPIYFNAWEYQRDISFSYSIITHLYKNYVSPERIVADKILPLARGLFLNSKLVVGVKDVASIETKSLEELTEDDIKNASYYDNLKHFKTSYKKLIEGLTKERYKNGIIIFIDDLDRCDPKKVLALLSDIRTLLSYSKDSFYRGLDESINEPILKIIFILGVDISALNQAIITNYGQLFEPQEYLEKIIDHTFILPHTISKEMLQYYLGESFPEIDTILRFLELIEFTNPRKLKLMFGQFKLHEIPDWIDMNYMKLLFTIFLYVVKQSNKNQFRELNNPINKFIIASEKSSIGSNQYKSDNTFSDIMRWYIDGDKKISKSHIFTTYYRSQASDERFLNYSLMCLWFGPKYSIGTNTALTLKTSTSGDPTDIKLRLQFFSKLNKATGSVDNMSMKFLEFFLVQELPDFDPFKLQDIFRKVNSI